MTFLKQLLCLPLVKNYWYLLDMQNTTQCFLSALSFKLAYLPAIFASKCKLKRIYLVLYDYLFLFFLPCCNYLITDDQPQESVNAAMPMRFDLTIWNFHRIFSKLRQSKTIIWAYNGFSKIGKLAQEGSAINSATLSCHQAAPSYFLPSAGSPRLSKCHARRDKWFQN